MNRRTALKAMLGGGLGVLGCRQKQNHPTKPLQVEKRISAAGMFHLIAAMEAVEMEGIPWWKWPETRGKDGELGPLQITKQYVDDVNRISRKKAFFYDDRLHRPACNGMIMIYWDHYATVERIGREPTLEDLARIHNGGPDGWKKECTKVYWQKVRIELERMNG